MSLIVSVFEGEVEVEVVEEGKGGCDVGREGAVR